jgi:hypothetical protein
MFSNSSLFKDYNILIFDEKYNHLNKWNQRLDGTKFNLPNKGSYLITKRDYFDVNEYDFIYHIFLWCYQHFNLSYSYDVLNQFIHLYPGGGFFGDAATISNKVNIISTNPITSESLEEVGHTNYKNIWNGPLMFDKEEFTERRGDEKLKLNVCFSSMGLNREKGATDYSKLVNEYYAKYPTDKINFISIGNCEPDPLITNYQPMDYLSLDRFYEKNVDIYINLSNDSSFNGWPLGLEALIKGAALITTDPNSMEKYYNLAGDEFFIIEKYSECISIIKKLYEEPNLLFQTITKGQNFFKQFITYDNTQKKIFEFINSQLKSREYERI